MTVCMHWLCEGNYDASNLQKLNNVKCSPRPEDQVLVLSISPCMLCHVRIHVSYQRLPEVAPILL